MRYIVSLIVVILSVFFVLFCQSIIELKIRQLQQSIEREEINNYRLSSESLEKKLKALYFQKEDFISEFKDAVQESKILNQKVHVNREIELSLLQKTGLVLVNIIRFISYKPILKLDYDAKVLIIMQLAFYLERTKNYRTAIEQYNNLQELLGNHASDELRFTYLHKSFCLAMQNNHDQALQELRKLNSIARGSHFQDSANILFRILQGQKKKESKHKIEELYSRYQFKDIVKIYMDKKNLSNREKFFLARSYEHSGNVPRAIEIYKAIIHSHSDRLLARQANRRLMLIGYVYRPNTEIKQYTGVQSRRLKDSQANTIAREAVNHLQKTVLFSYSDKKSNFWQKIKNFYPRRIFEQISALFSTTNLWQSPSDSVDQKKTTNKEKLVFKKKVTTPAIDVTFSGGQNFQVNQINFEKKNRIRVKMGKFFIYLSAEKIRSIQLTKYDYPGRIYYLVFSTHSGRINGYSYQKNRGSGVIKSFQGDREVSANEFTKVLLRYINKEVSQ